MSYSIATDWVLKFSRSATAIIDSTTGRIKTPIGAIEPDVIFTKNTIGVYISSNSADPNWYSAGDLYQAFEVGFGNAGFAEGENVRCVLNRYKVYKFNRFPVSEDSRYLLSFTPERYLKDIQIKVWEYIGTNQGATLESLEQNIKAMHQRLISEGNIIKNYLKKIERKL